MKHLVPVPVILLLLYGSRNAAESQPATNSLSGEVQMHTVRATAIEKAVSLTRAPDIWTNGVPFDNGQPQLGTVSQEIQLTGLGCEATWGRHKAFFDADIGSPQPIRVTIPDGKNIAFRPTFLVLANRVTGQQLLLAEVTNQIALLIGSDRVVWTNAFDRSGPEIDVEYHYTASVLEQNIVFRESPLKNLPPDWKLSDLAIEFWTESFFDTIPATVETRTAEIRAESVAEKALHAEDQDIGWDSMKIVAGGRAFSVGPASKAARSGSTTESDDADSLPVSKIWTEIDDGGRKRTFIIETLDALGAKPKLDALKEGRHASATRPASGRSEFLRLHASSANKDQRQASSGKPQPIEIRRTSQQIQDPAIAVLSKGADRPGFVLDFAIVNVVPIPPGIISWWPAGANALDAIANHNDGFLSNGVSYTSGKVGQGFSFGAYSNYVKVPSSASLNPTNALTIDCWVYLEKYGTNNMLVGKDNQVNQRQYTLTVAPGKTFRAAIGITNGTLYYIDSATLAATGVWTHVAMTYSAANSNLSIYVNGHLDTNATVVGSAISTTEPLFIGNAPRGTPYWWPYDPPGRIDEVDIFNRALSASEIQSIYDAGAAGKYNPNCITPSTNVVAWWPAETISYDIAGTNFAYPFNGSSYAAGAVRSAFSFDGMNDYFVARNGPAPTPTNALTLEAWTYLNSGTPIGNYPIISKDGCTFNRQYLLTVSGNQKFRAHIGTANCFCYGDGRTTVQSGGWYHVAMTYDTATSKLILYVNGAEDLTLTNIVGPVISTSEPVFIGGAPHSCFPYYFPGLIDEPTIYNRALSATEISAIYSTGSAGKCACYVTNQTFTCISPASVDFGPVSLTNSIFCLGNSFSASIPTTALNGTVRQTFEYSDCNTSYVDSSFASTVTTNWFVLTAPDGSSLGSNSLAVTFNPGIAGIWNLTFNFTYTNAYSPCTNPVTVSLSTNIYVVDLAGLEVNGYGPITDDGVTRTYVVCQDPSVTNITVTALSNPNLAESNLPPCWTLLGGTGTSQVTRTVDVSQVGTNVLSCSSPYSHFTNIIIVASHADADYDGLGNCEEIINGTNPNDAASTVQMRLGYWKFNDTNTWSGEQGQMPLIATNISAVTNWGQTAGEVASSGAALVYRTEESTGIANILCARGTVRFWFSPEWTSSGAGGSGPGIAGRFADVGHWTADGSHGWWSLAITPNGNSIQFVTQGDSATTTNLQAAISWTTGQWHQVAVTYTSTNTSIFVDGQPLNTNGVGVTHYPNATARAGGFSMGATAFGTNQVKGLFDEFETFNYPLTAQSISNDYVAGRPFLSPPIVTLDPTNDATGLNLSISHPQAIELDSTCDTNSFPNPVQFLVETNYADSWFAREPLHFDSSSVGVNLTKLPSPVIVPAGGNFNYPSNVTISLVSENLTNMVEGFFRTEFGRPSDLSGLAYWSSYAQNLRNLGNSDEQIRVTVINSGFRGNSEYIAKYGAAGIPYVANNNYTIEFCTNTDGPWLTYTGAIQVLQSVTLYSRVKKATSTDARTTYAYLTSDTNTVQFTVIPISWLTQNFGTNYLTNTNALPYADPDSDGLPNWQEFALGTNPNDSDTDYDGRRDGDEIADGTDPLDPNSFLLVALARWSFDGTNTWVGAQGQVPILASNVQAVASWSGSAAQLNSTNFAALAYACSDITNGPNINCRQGTIRFWLNPGWSSGGTNGGPGAQARLIDVGSQTGTNGWFTLFLSSDGTSMTFAPGMTNFVITSLNWVSNQWHQIALTYNETNTSLYIDGLPLVTNGYGIFFFPDATARSGGFSIGGTKGGTNQARGQIDEFETFNYPLATEDIAINYKAAISADSDGDGLPDAWEFNNNVSDPNADPDGDHLTNIEEYRAGTNPNKPDTDCNPPAACDGRTDWQEIIDGTDPLNPASKATWPVVAYDPYIPTGGSPQLYESTDGGNKYFALRFGDPNLKYDLYGTDDNNTFYWMGRLQMNVRYILIDPSKARSTYRLDTTGTSATYTYDLLDRLKTKQSLTYTYDDEGNIKTIAP